MPSVILTDEQGEPKGTVDIMEAHTGKGDLHLAFSAFIFRNKASELLLQQRSKEKMLFPEYWANTCCSHPREDDDSIVAAGERRLKEECGFTCPLEKVDSFIYRAEDPGRGVEHELDTILVGHLDEPVELQPDPKEIADLQWVPMNQPQADMKAHPERYAPWFHKGLKIILEKNAK